MERWKPAIIRHGTAYCCPFCWAQSNDAPDARFCSNCGSEIDNSYRPFNKDFVFNEETHEYELVNEDDGIGKIIERYVKEMEKA